MTTPEQTPANGSAGKDAAVGFYSCAQWPDGLLSFAYLDHDNTTRDRHDTQEQAQGVCNLLRRHGLGGERIHFPVRTWTEPIKSP